MGPISYAQEVAQPFAAAAQGWQFGNAIRDDQQQQQERAYQLEQRAKAQEAQQAMSRDLMALSAKKDANGQDYAAMMTRYPALAENLRRGWDTLNADQQQNSLNDASQVYSALQAGRADLAFDMLNTQAAAKINAGDEKGAQMLTSMARAMQANPDGMRTALGLRLAAIPGGDKVITGMHTMGEEQRAQQLQPFEMQQKAAAAAKTAAEAQKTGIESAYLPAVTEANINNTRATTDKTRADIEAQKITQQIAGLDVQIRQANSETERGKLLLDRQKLEAELAKTQNTTAQGAQDKLDTITQALSTVDAALNHPGLSKGTGFGSSVTSFFNGTDGANFRAQLEVVKSQNFLAQVKTMQGMGQLSNAEGEKISSAVAALDTSQSVEQLKNQLGVVRATLQKAAAKIIASGQAPVSGGPVTLTNPVSKKQITEGDINKAMALRPGTTREQWMKFFSAQGYR